MGDNQSLESTSPFLVVGLGNPGTRYERTPHNMGFALVGLLAQALGGTSAPRTKFSAQYTEHLIGTRKVLCICPQTYMNLSGNPVRDFVTFYKCDPEKDLVVITDDLDLPPGKLRLRLGGGSGGHNGLRSIAEQLGADKFPRLRIGIGRHPQMPTESYILAKVPASEWDEFQKNFDRAVQTLKMIPSLGFARAMDFCNQKEPEEKLE